MKYLLPIALVCLFWSCAKDRAQVAADARAGVHATENLLRKAQTAPSLDQAVAKGIADALAILEGVDKRLPAVAEVNSSEFPEPTLPAPVIQLDPTQYVKTAPPEPTSRGTPWGALAAAGLGALWLAGRVAPMVPGLGTSVGALADGAYALLAHRGQKATDQAQAAIASSAQAALPLLQLLHGLTPAERAVLPEPIRAALASPTAAALEDLVATTAEAAAS